MKIVNILTITTGANAYLIPQLFNFDYDLPTTTTGDYATQGWITTASTTTEELTTTLEPETTLTTTTDGEYTPPDITTTTMTQTELIATTNSPSSDLGPIIADDAIDCADKITEDPIDEPVGGWWTAAYNAYNTAYDTASEYLCYLTGC